MAESLKCDAHRNNMNCTLRAGHKGMHLANGGTWWGWNEEKKPPVDVIKLISDHTLYINTSYSVCGACRLESLPRGRTHTDVAGYDGRAEGCGAEWHFVSSDYIGPDYLFDSIRKMRPDLIFVHPQFLGQLKYLLDKERDENSDDVSPAGEGRDPEVSS